jgi:hypothetical protein
MNNHSAEYKLLKKITSIDLASSLGLLREAAATIWAPDAPRIVHDYTDHGIRHCERLTGFAAKLLKINNGRPLSQQEIYVLLAGIYLHDIGMQCDVVKFPAIKEKAVAFGAKFEKEFTAYGASTFSLEEQRDIRNNHQYLTMAWIDYAYRTHETLFGLAARTIPADLVADLIDVCRFHTKESITDCPLAFNSDPSERKQLVAAILRFTDELDIDKNRVSIEIVKNFGIDPNNSLYWWMHNLTNIVLSDKGKITLTVQLNPADKDQYESLIYG